MSRSDRIPDRERTGMSRRTFVRRAAVGAAAGGAALAAGPAGLVRVEARTPPAPAADPIAVPTFELEEMTIAEMGSWMDAGRFTARYVVDRYLERIESVDREGPALRSILEINPEAQRIADELDAERRASGARGPLHGIPILLKDNIETADRMQTSAGSLALLGSRPARDAHLVERLRRAGAVILGKTNLSEWANFRSTRSSSGWSARGGQCRNPYALDRNPCGSSSGSAVAPSANLCMAAIGTETDGSIVCPASANSVVGIKPTLGRVSRSGIIPIAHSQDAAGPMARTVADAVALLNVMAGPDPDDPATREAPGMDPDYTRHLDPDGLRGARVGIVRAQYSGFSEEADGVLEEAIAGMRDAGAEVVDPADIPSAGEFGNAEFEVLLYEFKADLERYLADRRPDAPVRTLDDLIRFNDEHRRLEMPYFGQEIFEMSAARGPLSDSEYRDALESSKRLAGPEGIDRVMDELELDALIAPTGSPAWPIDLINGDHYLGGSSSPAAVAGYPNITVPAGYVFGLPVGVSFFGRAGSEPKLIRIASGFEHVMAVRKTPGFRSDAGLM